MASGRGDGVQADEGAECAGNETSPTPLRRELARQAAVAGVGGRKRGRVDEHVDDERAVGAQRAAQRRIELAACVDAHAVGALRAREGDEVDGGEACVGDQAEHVHALLAHAVATVVEDDPRRRGRRTWRRC